MQEGPDIARLAALIGDPARANMLTALMDGRALTASELADLAGVTAPTASSHLAKLTDAALLQHRKQGRHKYFQLADAEVAATLEALMGLAAGAGMKRARTGPRDAAMREARVCYNHLAGRLGVHLFRSLTSQGVLIEEAEELRLTADGAAFLQEFGLDIAGLNAARAPLCRSCLDWSERRTHLAGSLGRALLARFEALAWMRRDPASRAIRVTRAGRAAFDTAFPIAPGA
jgi:DNA-binding transcriptional ArsR family regulator